MRLLNLSVRCVRALRATRSRRVCTVSPPLSADGALLERRAGVASFPPSELPDFIGTTTRSDFPVAVCLSRLFDSSGILVTSRRKERRGSPRLPQQHHVKRDRVFDPGCRRRARHGARLRFAFGVSDHLGAVHQEQSFGAQSHSRPSRQLRPFDLAPFLSTLQRRRCRRRCKTRYDAVGYSLRRRVLPPACCCDLAWSLRKWLVRRRA